MPAFAFTSSIISSLTLSSYSFVKSIAILPLTFTYLESTFNVKSIFLMFASLSVTNDKENESSAILIYSDTFFEISSAVYLFNVYKF